MTYDKMPFNFKMRDNIKINFKLKRSSVPHLFVYQNCIQLNNSFNIFVSSKCFKLLLHDGYDEIYNTK